MIFLNISKFQSFSDLVEIADKNLKMPPKCTYIEPKLVTALVMYDMK